MGGNGTMFVSHGHLRSIVPASNSWNYNIEPRKLNNGETIFQSRHTCPRLQPVLESLRTREHSCHLKKIEYFPWYSTLILKNLKNHNQTHHIPPLGYGHRRSRSYTQIRAKILVHVLSLSRILVLTQRKSLRRPLYQDYTPPEVWRAHKHPYRGPERDVWSLGVALHIAVCCPKHACRSLGDGLVE